MAASSSDPGPEGDPAKVARFQALYEEDCRQREALKTLQSHTVQFEAPKSEMEMAALKVTPPERPLDPAIQAKCRDIAQSLPDSCTAHHVSSGACIRCYVEALQKAGM